MQLRKCCNHPNLFYPISCTAPTALPQLSLPFPNIISESYKEDEALTFLRILKSDFIDEVCFFDSSTVFNPSISRKIKYFL